MPTKTRDDIRQETLEKRKQSNLKKFGVEYPSQNPKIVKKSKKTCLERYGVENPSQLKEIKEKKKKTCLKNHGTEYPSQNKNILKKRKKTYLIKYGVENPTQSEEIQKKAKQNCLKKYGVESTNKLQEVKNKKKQTCLERYGVENPFQLKEIKEKIKENKQKEFYLKLFQSNRLMGLIEPLFNIKEYNGVKKIKYQFKCKKCGNIFKDHLDNSRIPRCFKCYPIERFTQPHKSICEYLEKENIDFEIEKYISPYFVDIFIKPDKIIEVYGDYWHGNPKFYKEGEFLNLPNEKILVEKKWEYDEKRINYLKENRFKILILWQNEIENSKKSIIKKIKIFLNGEKLCLQKQEMI